MSFIKGIWEEHETSRK